MVATRAGLAAVVALAVACSPGARPHPFAATPSPATTATGPRYEISTLVIEGRGHGPEVCAGPIADSRPPLCGGPLVEPWDWSTVADQEQARGVTWIDVHLVGTYDGTVFHLTQPPGPPERQHPAPDPTPSPCATPSGGWRVVDPAKVSGDDLERAVTSSRRQPDVAGVWSEYLGEQPTGENVDYRRTVLDLAFTGDLDRHRHEARALWGGPLCVTRFAHTLSRLERIQNQLGTGPFQILSSSIREPANVVYAEVLVADDAAQRWMDERFGPGAVVLSGALRPVGS